MPTYPTAFLITLLMLPLITITLTDWRYMRIPNWASLTIFGLGTLSLYIEPHQSYMDTTVITLGILSLTTILRYVKGPSKPALGWGDVKLFAACGPWLRTETLPIFFIMTGLFGIVLSLWWRYKKGSNYHPMGVAICFSLILSLLIGQ